LQARKHNQFSAIKNVFGERQDSEKTDISWYQIEIFEFSWNKKNLFQDS
jgi:hypothetical protein